MTTTDDETTNDGAHVGTVGTIAVRDGALRVAVRIVATKRAYGRMRVRVTPVAGDGAAWMDAASVVIDGDARTDG